MTVICADPSIAALLALRREVRKILPDADIHICRSSETAVRLAEKHGCDVLITEIDFGRDKGEGIRLVKELGKRLSNVNIIFATTAQYNEYAALIIPIKYSGYLIKPYAAEALRKELQELRFMVTRNCGRAGKPAVTAG